MSENLEAVMRRIQKMLAIAQDERANPNEAANAAGMAERLMRKYQIENSDLVIRELKAGNDMSTEECLATAKTNGTRVKTVPVWANWMATRISDLNQVGATITMSKDWEAVVRFCGYKADVMVAKYMMDYLVATVNRLCNEFKKTPAYEIEGRKAVNSYRQGVALGICSSIAKLVAEKEAEQKAQISAGTSLVVIKQQAVVAKFGSVFDRKPTKTQVARTSAYSAGLRDGKQVDVNRRGITQQTSQGLLK